MKADWRGDAAVIWALYKGFWIVRRDRFQTLFVIEVFLLAAASIGFLIAIQVTWKNGPDPDLERFLHLTFQLCGICIGILVAGHLHPRVLQMLLQDDELRYLIGPHQILVAQWAGLLFSSSRYFLGMLPLYIFCSGVIGSSYFEILLDIGRIVALASIVFGASAILLSGPLFSPKLEWTQHWWWVLLALLPHQLVTLATVSTSIFAMLGAGLVLISAAATFCAVNLFARREARSSVHGIDGESSSTQKEQKDQQREICEFNDKESPVFQYLAHVNRPWGISPALRFGSILFLALFTFGTYCVVYRGIAGAASPIYLVSSATIMLSTGVLLTIGLQMTEAFLDNRDASMLAMTLLDPSRIAIDALCVTWRNCRWFACAIACALAPGIVAAMYFDDGNSVVNALFCVASTAATVLSLAGVVLLVRILFQETFYRAVAMLVLYLMGACILTLVIVFAILALILNLPALRPPEFVSYISPMISFVNLVGSSPASYNDAVRICVTSTLGHTWIGCFSLAMYVKQLRRQWTRPITDL
jgi:hypothetical protein